jgi:lipase ATG15
MPSDKTGITHIYHTADPIPHGRLHGYILGMLCCWICRFFAITRQRADGPQAMESKCHTGQSIIYDTVTVKGWSVDIRTHRIGEIINKVLADPWPGTEYSAVDDKVKTSWWGWGRKGPGKGKTGHEGEEEDDGGWEKHGGVPMAEPEDDCVDCFKWCVLIGSFMMTTRSG